MQQKIFGRRPQSNPTSAPPKVRKSFVDEPPISAEPASEPVVVLPVPERSDDVDAEVDHWKALRKAHKRSFREPWRTGSIVCGIVFALSSWLLPDNVANIAELVSGGLSIAAIGVGFVRPRFQPDKSATAAE